MSKPVGPVLGLDPCPSPFGLSVQQEVLIQYPGTDTGSYDPYWGVEEQTVSVPVPLMTGVALSRNPGTFASEGNPPSYVQNDVINNKQPVPPDWEP